MPARRFFATGVRHAGERLQIDGADAHKIVNVLRLRSGDEIELVDSAGTVFAATLDVSADTVHAQLDAARARASERSVVIDVAQGIPKGQKMDFVVEKLSELGVRAIIPFESERTIVRGVGASKSERWQRLARGAAAQSGRTSVLDVCEPVSFEGLCARMRGYDAVLFLWEVAQTENLRERLRCLLDGARTVLVVVGPEGGFSHAEAEAAQAAGAATISLGEAILRTETAALVAVAIVTYELS